MNILLVEDDELLAKSACLGLAQRGFVVDWVPRMERVREALRDGDYRCLLLDLALPDGDGLLLLRRLREQGEDIPVIVITASYELEKRVRGLELGADDYLQKPYSLDELSARIRAVMRRLDGRASNLLEAAGVRFDPQAGRVERDGEEVHLSASELRLLRYFMENSGKVLSRARLLRALLGDAEEQVSSNLLDVHIHHLRRKLGAHRIKTVRGMGYLFMNSDAPT
ncbi:MAG TPA: response regulator transcription factor [Chromatiales bacterium]|nr:response regulator transcription factor [Chromatiales bacterium]